MEVHFPKLNKLINDAFIPYWKNTDRYNIFYGSRGSSKSNFQTKRLIYQALTEPYFRCILIRQNYNTIKDSQWQSLKDTIFEMGLQSLFEFRLQPLEIECINGNKFLARGLDDTNKLKSIKDPSHAWWEEDIPSEEDFITVTTSIRTKKARFLQETFTINPELNGDYKEHWFHKKFFGDELQKTFRKEVAPTVYVSVMHSDYHMNKWLPPEFGYYLESLRKSDNPTNRYYYTIYALGEWGNKITGGLAYKMFDKTKTGFYSYDHTKPLWVSFDFNVNPAMHCVIAQVDGLTLNVIDELRTESPRNNTRGLCAEIVRKYQNHTSGMFVTGDPAGKHEDTRSEKGHNDYTIIRKELAQFNPIIKMHTSAPSVVQRINFINNIFEFNQSGITINIDSRCLHLINDFMNTKEAEDGTKHKEKAKNSDTGVTYEKWGHSSDCADYMIIKIFEAKYNEYLRGGSKSKGVTGTGREIIESHSY